MTNNTQGKSGGISFLGLLTILFIGLKLTGYITWSWWWVLAPVWVVPLIAVIFIVLAIILKWGFK